MAKDISVSLKQITGEVSQQDKALKSVAKSWADIEKTIGKITSQLGTNGGNKMSGSLGKMSAGERIGMGMAIGGDILKAGFGALPSTQSVIERATGYYNAGVMQGGNATMGQGAMYNRLRDGLGKFGIQSPMATAQLAQFYGQRGVTIGGRSGYEGQLTAEVGGAARYLNMDTNRAAAALEGLTAGAGGQSMNLLRTMGIFTADPRTGAVKTQKELFAEINSRLTAGRGAASVTDVQESFRRGNLGSFLKNSGMSEDQQQMYYLSELYRADTGKELDLSNRKEIDSAMKGLEAKGLVNPQQELNAIAASEEGVMQAGQASYLQGLKNAVPIIETLNKGMEGLAASVGGLKAMLDTIGSTGAGGAAGGLLGGLGTAAMTMASSYAGGKAGSGTAAAAAKGFKAPGVKSAGVIGAVVSGGAAIMNIANGAPAGAEVGSAIGATAGSILGAALGSFIPIPGVGTAIGAVAGGYLGEMGGRFIGGLFDQGRGGGYEGVGGATDTSGTKTSASGKDAKPTFVRPASGKITSKFGPRTPPTKGASSYHRGVDIANSAGTPIGSAADGKVTFSGTNGGYGLHIKVEHSDGYTTTYSHMSKLTAKKGDKVVAGQRIGSMGTTGTSTGVHLHFEVLKGGAHIDPATVVPGLGGGSVKATVTNTSREGAKTESQKKYSYANNFGGSGAANSNGSSSTSNTLGFSAPDTSEFLATPASTVNIFGNFRSIQNPKEDPSTGREGRGGPAAVGLGSSGGGGMVDFSSGSSRGGRGGIVINVNVKSASEAEARRFAKIVKDTLEDDSDIMKIGRM